VYVIEMAASRLQVFDANDQFLTCFDISANGVGPMNGPTGVAVGPSGEIYISDTMNHRILKMLWCEMAE